MSDQQFFSPRVSRGRVARAVLLTAAISVTVSALGLTKSGAATSQVALSFDEITADTYIADNHYASSGVIFDSDGGGTLFVQAYGPPSVLTDPSGGAFSLPSYLCGNNPADQGVRARFVDPTTLAPRTTDYVRVNVTSGPGPDLLTANVALIAFDANDQQIAIDSADTTLQFDTLTVSALGIARVVMPGTHDCFDDFTFDAPQTSPEALVAAACEDLEAAQETNAGTPAGDKLEDAADKCRTALGKLQQDPPDRQGASGAIEGAVGDVEAAGADTGVLLDAARLLATDAIDAAVDRGGNGGKIAEANALVADGDGSRTAAAYKDAAAKYKDALSKAEGA